VIVPWESAFLGLVHFLYLQKNFGFILILLVSSTVPLLHVHFLYFERNPQHLFLVDLVLLRCLGSASCLLGWHS